MHVLFCQFLLCKKEYFLRKHRGKREKTRENKIFEKVFKGKNFLFYIFAKKKRSLNGKCAKICPSAKAEGQDRIFIHGEKEYEARARVLADGVYLNDKTYEEMQMIGEYTGASHLLPAYLD